MIEAMSRNPNGVPTPAPILTPILYDGPSDASGSSRLLGEAANSEVDTAAVVVCWEGSREMEAVAEVWEVPSIPRVVCTVPVPKDMKFDAFVQP